MDVQEGASGPVKPGQVIRLLESELAGDGFDLLDVRLFQGGGRLQIRIYVDTPEGGIALDQVAKASRTVSMLLEEADLIDGKYVIEVSSPGIRRPLRTPDHFRAVCGQRIELKLAGGKRPHRLRAQLQEVRDDALLVAPLAPADQPDQGLPDQVVAWDEILEANLDIDFDAQALINADRRERKEQRRSERKAKVEAEAKGGRRRPRKGAGPDNGEPGDQTR